MVFDKYNLSKFSSVQYTCSNYSRAARNILIYMRAKVKRSEQNMWVKRGVHNKQKITYEIYGIYKI